MINFVFTERAAAAITTTLPIEMGARFSNAVSPELWAGFVPNIGDIVTSLPLDPLEFVVEGRRVRMGHDEMSVDLLLDLKD